LEIHFAMSEHAEHQSLAATDAGRIQLLTQRLERLVWRISRGESPNPTGLLFIRNAPLSEPLRLTYRVRWVRRLIEQRQGTEQPQVIALMAATLALLEARRSGLRGQAVDSNREAGARVAEELRDLQPGGVRLSRYCSRRDGPDAELLAVEFFARGLDWPFIDGTEDYLAAMYCICRAPDLRFRLLPPQLPKLRQLAADWIDAFSARDAC
jgi:hypothetical protein